MYTDRIPVVKPSDEVWMRQAIGLAQRGYPDDMPFGCILVDPNGTIWAKTWGTGNHSDPTAHSEMRAIQEVCHHRLMGHRLLTGCTLYSTHEPCSMCCGAINHAKISKVVWGSYRYDLPHLFRSKMPAEVLLADTSHPPEMVSGILRQECVELFANIPKWD